MLIVDGFHGTKDLKTGKCFLKIKGTKFKDAFNLSVCTSVNVLGKHKIRCQNSEAKLQSLKVLTFWKLVSSLV